MTIDPTTTALSMMDYQAGIIGRFADDIDALVGKVAAARDSVRRAGGHIAYVRVAFDPSEYRSVPAANKTFADRSPGPMNSDAPRTRIHPALAPADGDIDTLMLAGISTSGVVSSTVRDAADRDDRLVVVADCCADGPDVPAFLTTKIFPRQADVTSGDELSQLLSQGA